MEANRWTHDIDPEQHLIMANLVVHPSLQYPGFDHSLTLALILGRYFINMFYDRLPHSGYREDYWPNIDLCLPLAFLIGDKWYRAPLCEISAVFVNGEHDYGPAISREEGMSPLFRTPVLFCSQSLKSLKVPCTVAGASFRANP